MSDSTIPMQDLLADVSQCRICEEHLEPRPVLQASSEARLLIIGQAPGRKVHASGYPFDDASGDRLRQWLGIDASVFYDASKVAIMPMGFCYPGTGKNGDLPPRPECAPKWHDVVKAHMPHIRTQVVIGRYALAQYLPEWPGAVTPAVAAWQDHFPGIMPLVHPSPRNQMWLKRNPWFETDVVPALQKRVQEILN